ncbi:hypothetical protein [Vibrio rarus]|uniref:hypothetical protein n=1 Tax=Vibrio rarus TaxID=413403 RepID=UPI0021C2652C|nr:hypothetical protein [Vibrio rarus]
MKVLSVNAFMRDFGNAIRPQMNMSIYRDNFKCVCGQSHWFDESIELLAEGSMKVMVKCPNDPRYVTSLKIKTFMIFKFKGFESLAGACAQNSDEQEMLDVLKFALR